MTETNHQEHWASVEDLLDFAIGKEQEAVDFYTELAENARNPEMKPVFREFAGMEEGHKRRLQNIKQGGQLEASSDKVMDLKIADYLVNAEPGMDMSYQDALILAMKREQSAYNLYNDLAGIAEDKSVREAMIALADEEAKHKLRFETEYDEYVLKDN